MTVRLVLLARACLGLKVTVTRTFMEPCDRSTRSAAAERVRVIFTRARWRTRREALATCASRLLMIAMPRARILPARGAA